MPWQGEERLLKMHFEAVTLWGQGGNQMREELLSSRRLGARGEAELIERQATLIKALAQACK